MSELKMPTYGGQAVIEGVMMRGLKAVAIAMRAPNKEIVIHTENLGGIYKSRISKIPFLRGLVMLWDALGLGMRALTISANVQTDEEEKIEGPMLYVTLGISLIFGIGLFFLLPAVVGQLAENYLGISSWWGNLAEGVMRLFLLIAYIWLVALMPDIRRVYAYHGAEHKTIYTYENGEELDVAHVEKHSTLHPRCGTNFLLIVMIISILVFSILRSDAPFYLKFLSRIVFVPLIAGFSYELIRLAAKKQDKTWARWITKPGLYLQKITTKPIPGRCERQEIKDNTGQNQL